MPDTRSELVEDLFRRESARLVAALARLLGPAYVSLAEDVVQDALLTAMTAWGFELPRNPAAWLMRTAQNRAIDLIRRNSRLAALRPELLADDQALAGTIASALSPAEDASNQLAMMFSICDESLSRETHVTLILRWLCGLSPKEIARAFLVDTQTVDRRLHRGRARLQQLGQLHDVEAADDVRAREPSVLQALYLLFSEGYHGSGADNPLHPAMCSDAMRLAELLLESPVTAHAQVHALAALFYFNAARLPTRMDDAGVFVPLAEQDRSRWDKALIERGMVHLSSSSTGAELSRWHLEAGIACEHSMAPSVRETNWQRIVALYDELHTLAPTPIVALNRALAIAELRGAAAAREALEGLAGGQTLDGYPFLWAALADVDRRAGRPESAGPLYERAIALARNAAERGAYERELRRLASPTTRA